MPINNNTLFKRTLLNSQPLLAKNDFISTPENPYDGYKGVQIGLTEVLERQKEIEEMYDEEETTRVDSSLSNSLYDRSHGILVTRPEIIMNLQPNNKLSEVSSNERLKESRIKSLLCLLDEVDQTELLKNVILSKNVQINQRVKERLRLYDEEVKKVKETIDKYSKISNTYEELSRKMSFFDNRSEIYSIVKNERRKIKDHYVLEGLPTGNQNATYGSCLYGFEKNENLPNLKKVTNTSLFYAFSFLPLLPGPTKLRDGSNYRIFDTLKISGEPISRFLESLAAVGDLRIESNYKKIDNMLPTNPEERLFILLESLSYELRLSKGLKAIGENSIFSFFENAVGSFRVTALTENSTEDGSIASSFRIKEGSNKNIFLLEKNRETIKNDSSNGLLDYYVNPKIVDGTFNFQEAKNKLESFSLSTDNFVRKLKDINLFTQQKSGLENLDILKKAIECVTAVPLIPKEQRVAGLTVQPFFIFNEEIQFAIFCSLAKNNTPDSVALKRIIFKKIFGDDVASEVVSNAVGAIFGNSGASSSPVSSVTSAQFTVPEEQIIERKVVLKQSTTDYPRQNENQTSDNSLEASTNTFLSQFSSTTATSVEGFTNTSNLMYSTILESQDVLRSNMLIDAGSSRDAMRSGGSGTRFDQVRELENLSLESRSIDSYSILDATSVFENQIRRFNNMRSLIPFEANISDQDPLQGSTPERYGKEESELFSEMINIFSYRQRPTQFLELTKYFTNLFPYSDEEDLEGYTYKEISLDNDVLDKILGEADLSDRSPKSQMLKFSDEILKKYDESITGGFEATLPTKLTSNFRLSKRKLQFVLFNIYLTVISLFDSSRINLTGGGRATSEIQGTGSRLDRLFSPSNSETGFDINDSDNPSDVRIRFNKDQLIQEISYMKNIISSLEKQSFSSPKATPKFGSSNTAPIQFQRQDEAQKSQIERAKKIEKAISTCIKSTNLTKDRISMLSGLKKYYVDTALNYISSLDNQSRFIDSSTRTDLNFKDLSAESISLKRLNFIKKFKHPFSINSNIRNQRVYLEFSEQFLESLKSGIGSSIVSVGIPYGCGGFFSKRKHYTQISVSKRNTQFSILRYLDSKFTFSNLVHVVPQFAGGLNDVPRDFIYLIYSSEKWIPVSGKDAIRFIKKTSGLVEDDDAGIILKNHIVDSLCKLHIYDSVGINLDDLTYSTKRVRITQSSKDFLDLFRSSADYVPYGSMTTDDFLVREENRNYTLKQFSELGQNLIDKTDQQTHRILTSFLNDSFFTLEDSIQAIYERPPFERVYSVVLCEDDFTIDSRIDNSLYTETADFVADPSAPSMLNSFEISLKVKML